MRFLHLRPAVTLLPIVTLFIAALALSGCERQASSTNEADVTDQQNPASPAKPVE